MYGQGKTRGKAALLGIEAATNQACAAILPKDGIDPAYVFLNLCSRYDEIRALSNSGGQDNLSQGIVGTLSFPLPTDRDEQRKVANCLSSLDILVTAQSEKLDALKSHKAGLMQQLFPSPTEPAA
jgi:type I restriction enzyme, S subunit